MGDKILMVADGSAEFTRAAGLDADMTARGFGVRSQRYAMVIEDCVVQALNIEAPGQFQLSDANTIRALL